MLERYSAHIYKQIQVQCTVSVHFCVESDGIHNCKHYVLVLCSWSTNC